MFGGDVVLTWRPQNIVSIVLMAIGAGFVVVLIRQAAIKLGNQNNG